MGIACHGLLSVGEHGVLLAFSLTGAVASDKCIANFAGADKKEAIGEGTRLVSRGKDHFCSCGRVGRNEPMRNRFESQKGGKGRWAGSFILQMISKS